MNNKGLKITVGILAVIFAGCIVFVVIYKDDMDYQKAKEEGTPDAYVTFIEKHPNSKYCNAAKKSLDSLLYKNAISTGSIKEYVDFLQHNPESEYAEQVQQLVDAWDDSMYTALSENYDNWKANTYLQNLPYGKHASDINAMKATYEEDDVYRTVLSQNTVSGYSSYLEKYPQGKYVKDVQIKLAIAQENKAYSIASNQATRDGYREYLSIYPKGKHSVEIRGKLDELEAYDRYKDNSLNNGSQPYAYYYGYNRSCDYYGCSAIKVKAPYSSDVVVLIKNNNSYGDVVRHGYIRAGRTMTFELPDGRYQTFFYYGKGWYPNKKMRKGVKGGFLMNEVFSKDSPQYLNNQILTYELVLRRDGNFSTSPSNESEVF